MQTIAKQIAEGTGADPEAVDQAIYGGGQPSGEAHARLKETLVQRGIFKSGLMRKPVLPLNQEEKDWIAEGIRRSGLEKVDMSKFA